MNTHLVIAYRGASNGLQYLSWNVDTKFELGLMKDAMSFPDDEPGLAECKAMAWEFVRNCELLPHRVIIRHVTIEVKDVSTLVLLSEYNADCMVTRGCCVVGEHEPEDCMAPTAEERP